MLAERLGRAFQRLARFAADPEDSEELRLRKTIGWAIMLTASPTYFSYGLWYFAYGEPRAALIPVTAGVLNILSLVSYGMFRRYSAHWLFFVAINNVVMVMLHFELGGFASSGMVIIWILVAPMLTIVADRPRAGAYLALVGVVLMIAIGIADPYVPKGNHFPPAVIATLSTTNVIGLGAYMLLAVFFYVWRVDAIGKQVKTLYDQLTDLNSNLEQRVADGIAELERLGRMKRFLSPQVADLILAGGGEDPLKSHRREITVVFLDLRGFTAFTETSDPEEVMGVLREYHAEMGRLIMAHRGTLERFAGDGIMIFFNDPVALDNPAESAVRMALEMQQRFAELAGSWKKRGYDLGMGIGIAEGYATLGAIGFEERWDYGAIGNVTNVAARLCSEALAGQILVSQRVMAKVEALVDSDAVGELALKGLRRPVPTFNVRALRP